MKKALTRKLITVDDLRRDRSLMPGITGIISRIDDPVAFMRKINGEHLV